MLAMPESPYFLMSKYNDEKNARKALSWIYNGNDEDIERVMEDIRLYQKTVKPKETSGDEEKKCKVDEKNEKTPISMTKKSAKYFSGIKFVICHCYIDWFHHLICSFVFSVHHYSTKKYNFQSLGIEPGWK